MLSFILFGRKKIFVFTYLIMKLLELEQLNIEFFFLFLLFYIIKKT